MGTVKEESYVHCLNGSRGPLSHPHQFAEQVIDVRWVNECHPQAETRMGIENRELLDQSDQLRDAIPASVLVGQFLKERHTAPRTRLGEHPRARRRDVVAHIQGSDEVGEFLDSRFEEILLCCRQLAALDA